MVNWDSTLACMRQSHGVFSSYVSSFPPETGSVTITEEDTVPSRPAHDTPPSHDVALLPELDDRRGEVDGAKRDPVSLVPTQGVLHALWCVPAMVAVGPGQILLERVE